MDGGRLHFNLVKTSTISKYCEVLAITFFSVLAMAGNVQSVTQKHPRKLFDADSRQQLPGSLISFLITSHRLASFLCLLALPRFAFLVHPPNLTLYINKYFFLNI